MNIHLGLRTLALLAFVAAATLILVHPALVGHGPALDPAFASVPTLAHN